MTYELAKKLKDAGFPQHAELLISAESLTNASPQDMRNFLSRDMGRHITFDYSIYPEPIPDDWSQGKARSSALFSKEFLESEDGVKYTVYNPTLSELIEACDIKSNFVLIKNGQWNAGCGNGIDDGIVGTGNTAIEAVANLYLALNKKP